MLDNTSRQSINMDVKPISHNLKTLFPSLSAEWIRHILEDGEIISAQQNQNNIFSTDGVFCIIILDGLLLAEDDEGATLLQKGDVYGLRETLFSADNVSINKYASNSIDFLNTKFVSTSNKTLFIKIDGEIILKDMETKPQLREDWLQVLNQSFERQLSQGLDLYNLDTLDRVRQLIKKLKQYADERFEMPIKHIQSLTGVSRSSIYRCLKTLENEEQFIFCNKGQICFDTEK